MRAADEYCDSDDDDDNDYDDEEAKQGSIIKPTQQLNNQHSNIRENLDEIR